MSANHLAVGGEEVRLNMPVSENEPPVRKISCCSSMTWSGRIVQLVTCSGFVGNAIHNLFSTATVAKAEVVSPAVVFTGNLLFAGSLFVAFQYLMPKKKREELIKEQGKLLSEKERMVSQIKVIFGERQGEQREFKALLQTYGLSLEAADKIEQDLSKDLSGLMEESRKRVIEMRQIAALISALQNQNTEALKFFSQVENTMLKTGKDAEKLKRSLEKASLVSTKNENRDLDQLLVDSNSIQERYGAFLSGFQDAMSELSTEITQLSKLVTKERAEHDEALEELDDVAESLSIDQSQTIQKQQKSLQKLSAALELMKDRYAALVEKEKEYVRVIKELHKKCEASAIKA